MKIVLASSNKHKVQEINDIVKGSGIEFVLPPDTFDPEENGKTFEENSYIKAKAAWDLSKTWVLADDSGLCIDFLNGKPGIYSARYEKTPELRIKRVLSELGDEKNRHAHFSCSMTLLNPKGDIAFACEGVCEGVITYEPKGINGFGYDPIFLVKGLNKTMAELSEGEKNQISHRSVALRQVLNYLNSLG